jgi:EAL domain-containing protein (putative c-di-GMP-specific phosphodiesterase class I)
VVHLGTGQIVGMEALLRWEHPERGMILPDEFVPLAEEIGLIIPIGRWVLCEAFRQAHDWRKLYHAEQPLSIGVNVSTRQLRDSNLVEDVEELLLDIGMEPKDLVLEITESAVVEAEEHRMGILRRMQALGVRFALDDFGTGYSSLSYLKRMPVSLLKIDRSFVERIGHDAEDEVLVSGIVYVASGLGLSVVAEGVETPQQLAWVKSLGCELGQGNCSRLTCANANATIVVLRLVAETSALYTLGILRLGSNALLANFSRILVPAEILDDAIAASDTKSV